MINNNSILSTLFTIIAGIALIYGFASSGVSENFVLGCSLGGVKMDTSDVIQTDNSTIFAVPGTYQSMLPPRIQGVSNLSSYSRYKLPDVSNLALNPNSPIVGGCGLVSQGADTGKYVGLQATQLVKENYSSDKFNGSYANIDPVTKCQASNALNFNDERAKLIKQDYVEASDMLPVQSMDVNMPDGKAAQVVMMDRLMVAPTKSRYALGGVDWIRGDLQIIPRTYSQEERWFMPRANPAVDLNRGAMFALFGNPADLGTSNSKAYMLINEAAGGTASTYGGSNIATQKSEIASAALGDVSVVNPTAVQFAQATGGDRLKSNFM